MQELNNIDTGQINIINKGYRTEFNSGYYKDETISFYCELLGFFSFIRNIYSQTNEKEILMKIQEKEYRIDIHSENASEILVEAFLKAYQNEEQDTIDIMAENYDNIIASYEKNKRNIKVNNRLEEDKAYLDHIIKSIEYTFLEEEEKRTLVEKITPLYDFYCNNEEHLLFTRKQIFCFLNDYYEILRWMACTNGLLSTSGVVECILIPLLNLGVEYDENTQVGRVKMTSPVVLSGLNLAYYKLNEYLRIGKKEIKEFEEYFYREIYLDKMRQMNRFYLIREKKGDLFYATLLPYKEDKDDKDEKGIALNVRGLSTFNSYQGIRELRLAEKILFELSQLNEKEIADLQDNKYRVYILGDIYEKPMEKLIDYIKKSIEKKPEYNGEAGKSELQKVNVEFIVYSIKTKESNSIDEGKYKCTFKRCESLLWYPEGLKNIIENGNLFFFLDNCQLYEPYVEEINDLIIFRQRISYENYEEYFRNSGKSDLTLKCKFMELFEAMVTYAWDAKLGRIKKRAKESLLKFIRDKVGDSKSKTAYIYMSDIDAIKSLYCIQQQIVRIEKYSQKKIGIIRFSNRDKSSLPITYVPAEKNAPISNCDEKKSEGKRILVFNMWQLVKHNVLNQQERFEELLFKTKEDRFLDEIYIGMDYSNWKKKVVFSCYCEGGNLNEENLKNIMQFMAERVFSSGRKDMYEKYIKKSFESFLYGSAKSVEDLVFLHIFKREPEKLGNFKPENQDEIPKDIIYNDELKSYYNYNCKYSYKKIYWEAIEKLDSSGASETEKYLFIRSIRDDKNYAALKHSENPAIQFLQDIKQSCKNIGYEESELYQYCSRNV